MLNLALPNDPYMYNWILDSKYQPMFKHGDYRARPMPPLNFDSTVYFQQCYGAGATRSRKNLSGPGATCVN
jgi:hypothetical protein